MCVHEPTICFSPDPLQTCGPTDHWLAETVGMIVSAQRSFPSAPSVAKVQRWEPSFSLCFFSSVFFVWSLGTAAISHACLRSEDLGWAL